MASGLRVIRGPDWNLDDGDGGEGHVGTLAEVKDGGKVNIVWDGGEVTLCRAAQGEGHDLRVLDNATVGIRHPHIVCDECGESGIVGMRWKCTECEDFDLCTLCYFSDKHDCNHQFYRYETPKTAPEKQERRSKSMKMRVLGIFPDATVERGRDWEWKDQDGGQGSTGRVLELLTPAAHSARSTVKVEWENGRKNVYRLGYKGKVDLQYTEEAPGLECYPQHLPAFDVSHYSEAKLEENRVSDNITDGDNVVIAVGAGELQNLQKARSGWAVGMAECIGKVGKVQGFAANGDAIVNFGAKRFRLFPGALKKVGSITVGSRVRILDDEQRVKLMQDGHGGYTEQMKVALGKVGEVIKVDGDGDVVVKFGEQHWVFAPACCTPAPGADLDRISLFEGVDPTKLSLGGLSNGGDLMGLLHSLAQATGQMVGGGLFIKLLADKEESQALTLLQKDPKLAKSETQGFTALHVATNRGLTRATKALVEGGADLDKTDKDGDTPLMNALSGGNPEVAEYLIQKGCVVTARNKDGQTAAHKAAMSGFDRSLQLLLSRGADFNAQDNNGDTPLHDAILKGRVGAAEVIMSSPQVDLHRTNRKGHPPLHLACMKDEPEIVERMIRHDRTIVDEKKEDGFTPLHMCACNNHDKTMQILLEKGNAKVDVTNVSRQTPLHVAAHECALSCVQLLLKHGAQPNSRDAMGNTALHVAMIGPSAGTNELALLMLMLGQSSRANDETRSQIARCLIQYGADPDVKNNEGITALTLCISPKVKEDVQRFIRDKKSRKSDAAPILVSSPTTTAIGGEGGCKRCSVMRADVLMVPCGHRPVCKDCCAGLTTCPECGSSVKTMYDKDGRKISDKCVVM